MSEPTEDTVYGLMERIKSFMDEWDTAYNIQIKTTTGWVCVTRGEWIDRIVMSRGLLEEVIEKEQGDDE